MKDEAWLSAIRKLGLDHRYEWQLRYARNFLSQQITRVERTMFLPRPGLSLRENRRRYMKFEKYKREKIARLKHKLACVKKELEFREKGVVKRDPIGTTYYLDVNGVEDTLFGKWTFTNGSSLVTSGHGKATTELEVGYYVRPTGGEEWYKVTSINNDDEFVISPAFQQTSVSDVEVEFNNYNGIGTLTPYVHLNQFTTDHVRIPGDVLKVRTNQTHVYAGTDIVFDECGTVEQLIQIKGCSADDNPWFDDIFTPPVIRFRNTANQLYMDSIDYWKLSRLEFCESTDTYGILHLFLSNHITLDRCYLRDASYSGLNISYSGDILIRDSWLWNNTQRNIDAWQAEFKCVRSCLYGGSSGTDEGLYLSPAVAELVDCLFGYEYDGDPSAHDEDDVLFVFPGSRVHARNCKFEGYISFNASAPGCVFHSEDHNQKGAHKSLYLCGRVVKVTDIVRTGGASSSAKMVPNYLCGPNFPLTIAGDFCAGDFRLWLPAEQKTVTIYLRTYGYSTLPTANELYIEASYLDESSGGHRAVCRSTQTVSANDTWTAFSVTFTPAQEGWVYVTVFLKKYESNSGVYVDIKPVVS